MTFYLGSKLTRNLSTAHDDNATNLAGAVTGAKKQSRAIPNRDKTHQKENSEITQSESRHITPAEVTAGQQDGHHQRNSQEQCRHHGGKTPPSTEAVEVHPVRKQRPQQPCHKQKRQEFMHEAFLRRAPKNSVAEQVSA